MSLSAWELLSKAREQAWAGHHAEMVQTCQTCVNTAQGQTPIIQEVGRLLLQFGSLENARKCFDLIKRKDPTDLTARLHLANIKFESGDIQGFRSDIQALLETHPEHPVLQRNYLMGLEYDPEISQTERLHAAKFWGEALSSFAPPSRPTPATAVNRPLRVGYVSGDFCRHTVGLFLRGVVEHHDPQTVDCFCYSNTPKIDAVSEHFIRRSQWRDITQLSDSAVARQIYADRIDVLIDLSGHSAGSRLSVFALRPAPLQVAWLGYFATTGLPAMDAIILDPWHAPMGMETQFTEAVVHLPKIRFCFQPLPGTPLLSRIPPCLQKGYVTFGSFNNTSKLNPTVLSLWAEILRRVPDSRLLLKWRTLADQSFKKRMLNFFALRGIAQERIILRPASFHADMLMEYSDVDIALDPFPFSGGITSCETLWMGVPLITLPQDRMVSRQTAAILSVLGLFPYIANSEADYIALASHVAQDTEALTKFRHTIRDTMAGSPLMQVDSFTRDFENTLVALYQKKC